MDLAGSLIVWLRPLLAPAAVVANVPRELPDAFVVIRRIGGSFDHPVVDQPTITMEAWAKTQSAAHELGQDARALIWGLHGSTLNGAAIYRVEEFSGLGWLPEPDHDGRPRYVATFSIRHREHLPTP